MFPVLRYILVVASLLLALNTRAEILFHSDFESGSFQDPHGYYDGWFQIGLPGALQFTNSGGVPSRAGSKMLKMSISRGQNYTSLFGIDVPRADLGKSSSDYRFLYNRDYWVGFSVFIPSSWTPESDDQNEEAFMQIKHWGGGSAILVIAVDQDKWWITNRNDATHDGFNSSSTKVSELYRSSFLNDRGKWVDWAVRFRLCETSGCNGLIEIYKNGSKVASKSGANAYKVADGLYPYLTLDLYKPKWKERSSNVSSREVYFDEVKIGGRYSSLGEVSPSSKNVNLAPLPPQNIGIN